MRQAIRILVLIVLVVLLLPYLLAPLYLVRHPVSTLIAQPAPTGSPVSREWVDFAAVAARGGAADGDPAQSGQAQRTQSRRRGGACGRDLHCPCAVRRIAAVLERKSRFLSQLGVF